MMTREEQKNRKQIQIMSLDDLVPQDHLVRKLEAALDWNFIYELVAEKYSEDSGRPSVDPVVLIKLPVIQYIDDLHSQMTNLQKALALTEKKLAFYEELLQQPAAQNLTYLEEWDLFKRRTK